MSQPHNILEAVLMWMAISTVMTLQVYDCDGHGAKYKMISLSKISLRPR